ncbi:MAG: class A beta-lactamase-related serine hydrolase [Acidobacteriota bacterium]|nr:class A beta-lactamase-related serine hydrolase [Acidobacteriota bacterium]
MRTLVFASVLCLAACSGAPVTDAPAAQAQLPAASPPPRVDAALQQRLEEIASRAGGTVGVAVLHIESGRIAANDAAGTPLPLFSVFKLPVAIVTLKNIEEGRLSLETRIHVEPKEVRSGVESNSALWRVPSDRTVREMIDLSMTRSDNTSVDKLMEKAGGAAAVAERLRALGVDGISITGTVRDFRPDATHPNMGTARGLVRLLARLHKGEVLAAPQRQVLLEIMSRQLTGDRRLKGGLPPGTAIAAKTGTGRSNTNDAGIITLPDGKGHLAMAVLISGSPLAPEAQEALIAELARAAMTAAA